MTPEAFYRQVYQILKDERGEWRELQSCADAVQDISLALDQVQTTHMQPRAAKTPESRQLAPGLVQDAIYHLRCARTYLQQAGAVRTLARVQLALSSALGARRHANTNAILERAGL